MIDAIFKVGLAVTGIAVLAAFLMSEKASFLFGSIAAGEDPFEISATEVMADGVFPEWSTVTGLLKNQTSRRMGYVHISINSYDASGAQVESSFDNVLNLDAGGSWRFEVGMLKPFERYEIVEVEYTFD